MAAGEQAQLAGVIARVAGSAAPTQTGPVLYSRPSQSETTWVHRSYVANADVLAGPVTPERAVLAMLEFDQVSVASTAGFAPQAPEQASEVSFLARLLSRLANDVDRPLMQSMRIAATADPRAAVILDPLLAGTDHLRTADGESDVIIQLADQARRLDMLQAFRSARADTFVSPSPLLVLGFLVALSIICSIAVIRRPGQTSGAWWTAVRRCAGHACVIARRWPDRLPRRAVRPWGWVAPSPPPGHRRHTASLVWRRLGSASCWHWPWPASQSAMQLWRWRHRA